MTAAMPIRELARAKINLTLTVHGRRPDGYHELESLVTFADVADEVVLHPGSQLSATTTGPFAAEIAGANLVETTLRRLRDLDAGLQLGSITLTKNLPVAAGLGGGSADAAAVLRAVRSANPGLADRVAWHDVAARLGADVPVCLAGQPTLMWGIGEKLEPLAQEPARPGGRPRQSARAAIDRPGVSRRSTHLPAPPSRRPARADDSKRGSSARPDAQPRQRSRAAGNRAAACHRRHQGSARRPTGLPARRALRQRADLLRHLLG